MRSAAFVGLALALFAPHATAQQPQPPYRATVIDPDVPLRAGPSDKYAEAGTLPHGSTVIVEREDANGWLAITAPSGSISWVATQFIEDSAPDKTKVPRNVLVSADDGVTLATGKVGVDKPLDSRLVQVPNGTGLVVIGPPVTVSGKTWYPVIPPAGDLRYVPKTALQFEKTATSNFTVRASEGSAPIPPAAVVTPVAVTPVVGPPGAVSPLPPGAGPVTTVSSPGSLSPPADTGAAAKVPVNNPLWIKAETAERENRLADAEQAYFELAAQMNGPNGDHDVANLCYTRIHAIREKKRATGNTTAQPASNRGVQPGAPQVIPTASGSSSNANPKPDATAGGDQSEWIGPGTLCISALTLDGIDPNRRTYALETAPGAVKVYVLAGPGVDLSKFRNTRVNVFGTQQTRQGVAKPYVIATKVEPAP